MKGCVDPDMSRKRAGEPGLTLPFVHDAAEDFLAACIAARQGCVLRANNRRIGLPTVQPSLAHGRKRFLGETHFFWNLPSGPFFGRVNCPSVPLFLDLLAVTLAGPLLGK